MSAFGSVDFEAFEPYSEKRLSAAVREVKVLALLAGADDWETLGALVTEVSTERVPDGEYTIDELGGAGTRTLVLDARGTFTAYLLPPTLTDFSEADGWHLASLEFLVTDAA